MSANDGKEKAEDDASSSGVGEATTKQGMFSQSRKKWLVVLIMLVAIGVVVGVVIGVTSSDYDGETPTSSAQVGSTAMVDECITLAKSSMTELTLSLSTPSSNCFVVPGAASERYQLTIRNEVYGRYGIIGDTMGYAWNSPADGIFYCAQGGLTITFDEYVEGATVSVVADLVEEGNDCFSDFISFNGDVPPVETPPNGVTTEVYWPSHRYYLHAKHFEYKVVGEDPVTMENATRIDVSGDPGNDAYFSIEVIWHLNGLEKRLFAYINGGGDVPMWSIGEIRVYNEMEDWEYFDEAGVVFGEYGACFTAENLTIANIRGSEVKFLGLTVAAGLPWADESSYFECIGRAR